MKPYKQNPLLQNIILPVDIVLSPAWWYRHGAITFDEDFFFHPAKRVEAEQKMEQILYERWGRFGLGKDYDKVLPQLGAVHLAAGFLLSEMLGCRIIYNNNTSPQVVPANQKNLHLDSDAAFASPAFHRFLRLWDNLKSKFGYLIGDVNWSGVLNLALDLRGEQFFMDMFDKPDQSQNLLQTIGRVIEKFSMAIEKETGTSSISVNRNVRHLGSVFLHSECSNTMISEEQYEKYLLPIDVRWSQLHRPFGIHYCGSDPHRYAKNFAKLPYLDFLDVGWPGNVNILRQALPNTFLNLRLSPVEIVQQKPEEIRQIITRVVRESANPYLTGICCINMDDCVTDEKITAILETAEELRLQYTCEKK